MSQNQTQSHPQWCFIAVGNDNRYNISNVGEINCHCLVSFWSSLNGKSGYPGSKKWLPRFKKLVTYTQDEHVPQNQTQSHLCFIAVGSDNRCNISNVGEINCRCLVSFWSSLNGKSGYPGSKNWLPIHNMNMCHKPKLTPTHDPTMDQQTTINAHNNRSTIHQRSISDFVYLNVEGHTTTDVCSYLRLEVLPFSLPPQCRRRRYKCLLSDWITPSTVSSLTPTDVPFFHHRRLCNSLENFAPNSSTFTTKKNSEITILPSHKLTLTSVFTKNRRCLVQYHVFCMFVYVGNVKSV